MEADFQEHRYPEGRAAPPSFPSRTARKVRQRLGDTAVLGNGGLLHSRRRHVPAPRGPRTLYTARGSSPGWPARGPVRGSPERRLKAAWLEGSGKWESARSPEMLALRAASSSPKDGGKTVNK